LNQTVVKSNFLRKPSIDVNSDYSMKNVKQKAEIAYSGETSAKNTKD